MTSEHKPNREEDLNLGPPEYKSSEITSGHATCTSDLTLLRTLRTHILDTFHSALDLALESP